MSISGLERNSGEVHIGKGVKIDSFKKWMTGNMKKNIGCYYQIVFRCFQIQKAGLYNR